MTKDLIQSYKDIFKDNRVVLDTYKLARGYYYLIKSNNEIEKLIVDKTENINSELYNYIKVRDFYSVYLNQNKAIDTTLKKSIEGKNYNMLKKIASTNIYSLFFKNRFIKGFCDDEAGGDKEALPVDFFKEGIKKYYDSLYLLGKHNIQNADKESGYTKEEIEKYLNSMQMAFDIVLEDFQNENKPKDTWIKILLDNSEDEYKRVSKFYVNEKIFNKDTNKVIEKSETYGINNYNFNANSKKPFLELKSTSYKIASLINTEDINVLRRIYVWLYNNGIKLSNLKIPQTFDFHGEENDEQHIINQDIYEMKISNDNGNAKIENFEYVPNFSTQIVTFEYKDVLHDNKIIYTTSNIYGLEWLINDIWITHNKDSETNYIRNSYFDYDEKIAKSKGLSNWKKKFLKTYSDSFKELFQKEDKKIFVQNLYKIAVEVIENTLVEEYAYKKGFRNNAILDMNLWLCLNDYFNKKDVKIMKMIDVKERCKKILEDNGKIQDDDEYYFLVGQVAYYLLSKSKASKLTQDVTEPFITANNIKILNKELKYLYERYNYDIYLKDRRFNNIYSQILLCKPDKQVKESKDIILAGMLSENMFYGKKDGGNNNENE